MSELAQKAVRAMRTLTWAVPTIGLITMCADVSVAAAATTKPQYIAKADAICSAGNSQIAPVKAELDKLNTNTASGLAKGAQLTQQIVTLEKGDLHKLRALATPAGDSTVLAKVWNSLGGEILAEAKFASELNNLNESAVSATESRIKLLDARYRGLAQGYGFKTCGAST